MAHRKSCDTCPSTSDEEYPTGWGVFMGFDPEKMTPNGKKDLCPRCTLAIATAIVELRKMLAAKAVADTTVAKDAPYDPNMPGNLGRRLPR